MYLQTKNNEIFIFMFSGSISYIIERCHFRSNFFVAHCYQCFIFGKSKKWNMCDVFFQVCHIFIILTEEVYALSLFSRNFITRNFCIINVQSKIFFVLLCLYEVSIKLQLKWRFNWSWCIWSGCNWSVHF